MEHISHSLEETKRIASEWLSSISSATPRTGATIIGLSGNLGSGKTTFTQAVAQKLGITEFVTSPTFVIMKIYPTKHAVFKKLIHIDVYRFEKSEELNVLDLNKLASDQSNLILIEWPEKVQKALPAGVKTIKFEVVGEHERKITFP